MGYSPPIGIGQPFGPPQRGQCVRKTSWFAIAGFLAVTTCLSGCTGSRDEASASTKVTPAEKNLVIVTWRPVDMTSEFLSAWRAKD